MTSPSLFDTNLWLPPFCRSVPSHTGSHHNSIVKRHAKTFNISYSSHVLGDRTASSNAKKYKSPGKGHAEQMDIVPGPGYDRWRWVNEGASTGATDIFHWSSGADKN